MFYPIQFDYTLRASTTLFLSLWKADFFHPLLKAIIISLWLAVKLKSDFCIYCYGVHLKKRPFRYILNQAFKSFVKFLTLETAK